jgi:hypothetical protein
MSSYLQRVYYYTGESLSADDFIVEQQYFRDQFLTLYSYYFSPGIAGLPTLSAEKRYRLGGVPQPPPAEPVGAGPLSFGLTLVSQAPPPAPQDNNYLIVGPGLAVDSLGRQISLLSSVIVGNALFNGIAGAEAYLTIASGVQPPSPSQPRYVEAPVFQAFPVNQSGAPGAVPYGPNQFYLATVELAPISDGVAIVGVRVDGDLRIYSRPYQTPVYSNAGGQGDAAAPEKSDDEERLKIEERFAVLTKEIGELQERLGRVEKPRKGGGAI